MSGLASGLRATACVIAPDRPSAAPTSAPVSGRGSRSSRTTNRWAASPPPASAASTSASERGKSPRPMFTAATSTTLARRHAHLRPRGAAATVTFYADGQLGAYTSQDLRSRLLADLGLRVPAEVDAAAGDRFYAPVSAEQGGLVDRDVLVWITATPAEVDAVRALPLRRTLDAAREGREVFLPFDLNGAMSFSSPLRIPHLLDGLVPELRAAVDGDPATAVPSAAG